MSSMNHGLPCYVSHVHVNRGYRNYIAVPVDDNGFIQRSVWWHRLCFSQEREKLPKVVEEQTSFEIGDYLSIVLSLLLCLTRVFTYS